jgi:four helix bundle protein
MKDFRTYQDSVRFYRLATGVKVPRHLLDHLVRAAASISLNLAEGYGRASHEDRRRFYRMALGSLRECQAALELAGMEGTELGGLADRLGGSLYRLCTWRP